MTGLYLSLFNILEAAQIPNMYQRNLIIKLIIVICVNINCNNFINVTLSNAYSNSIKEI